MDQNGPKWSKMEPEQVETELIQDEKMLISIKMQSRKVETDETEPKRK